MYIGPELSTQPPAVIVHLIVASGALVLGPVALWLRKGSRGHRAIGYAWITMMVMAALSSVFIRDYRLPNLAGYTPIHSLTLLTFVGLGLGVWFISRRDIARHRRAMRFSYVAVVIAGGFALLPSRYLGGLLWHDLLRIT